MLFARSTVVSALIAVVFILAPPAASAAPYAYVPNRADDTVSVIDLAINTVISTIPVGNSPHDAIVSHDGSRVYVANQDGSTGFPLGSISVINTGTSSVIDTWTTCAPFGLALNPASTTLYVSSGCWTSSGDDSFVQVIPTADGPQGDRILVGPKSMSLGALLMSLDGGTLYLALNSTVAPGLYGVLAIDLGTGSISGRLLTDSAPGHIARNPAGNRYYVTNRGDDVLSVFDGTGQTSLLDINVGNEPIGVAVNNDGSLVYVANRSDNSVTAIDAGSNLPVATISVGAAPIGINFSPRGDRAYVICSGSDLVSVIDTASHSVINNILVGDQPIAFASFVSPAASIYVDPSHHDFGDVSVGQSSATQNIMIHNEGTAVMDLGQIIRMHDTDDQFNIDVDLCSNNTLASNGSCGITVSFTPTSFGDKTADVGIPSDDPNSSWLYVSLTGSARAPKLGVVGYSSPLPNNLSFSLGAAEVGETVVLSRVLVNEGNETLHLETLGSVNALAAPFALAQDNCSNMDLGPGSTCELIFSFAPTVDGHQNDTFNLPSDDPTQPNREVDVRGWASALPVGNIRFFDDVDPLDDSLVPFGDVAAGDTSTAGVFLFNIGSINELTASAIRIVGDDADQFAFDPTAAAVEACGALPIVVPGPVNPMMPPQFQPHPCEVTVTFAPTFAGDKTATLEIDSNDPDEATVSLELSGRALAPRIEVIDSLAYGEVLLQTPVVRQVSVENLGTTDLTLSSIAITGDTDFALDFESSQTPCTGATQVITPAHSCSFTVVFTPTSEGSFTANVTLGSDDPGTPSATVVITGEGFQHALGALPGDPDEDGGCSCTGNGTAPSGLALLLLGLLTRRRHRRQ